MALTYRSFLVQRNGSLNRRAAADSRVRARRLLAGLVVAAATLATSQFGAMSTAAAENDFAGGQRENQTLIEGFRGTQEIRTNPAPPGGGITIAHPFQVYFPGTIAFFAVGTYKGAAIDGTSCAANNGNWSSYIDGATTFDNYFCNLQQAQAYSVGSTPNFQIGRVFCNNGQYGWAVWINGTLRQCRPLFSQAGTGGFAGLEAARGGALFPPAAYNIDVIHTGLEQYRTGAWQAFNADILNTRNPGYSVGRPNTRRVNAWHGTLD